jgi:hypothetical protein
MDFPLASWLETVRPARCNRSKSPRRGASGEVVDAARCGAYVTNIRPNTRCTIQRLLSNVTQDAPAGSRQIVPSTPAHPKKHSAVSSRESVPPHPCPNPRDPHRQTLHEPPTPDKPPASHTPYPRGCSATTFIYSALHPLSRRPAMSRTPRARETGADVHDRPKTPH